MILFYFLKKGLYKNLPLFKLIIIHLMIITIHSSQAEKMNLPSDPIISTLVDGGNKISLEANTRSVDAPTIYVNDINTYETKKSIILAKDVCDGNLKCIKLS